MKKNLLLAIRNNRIKYIATNSREMATFIKEEHKSHATIDTLARSIRKNANTGNTSYHGYYFDYIEV